MHIVTAKKSPRSRTQPDTFKQ